VHEENVLSDRESSVGNKNWKPLSTPMIDRNFQKAYKTLASGMISAGDAKFMPALPQSPRRTPNLTNLL